MRPERFSGNGCQAVRDHRSAWDQFDSEPDFDRGGAPSTLVRFRDYGPDPAEPEPGKEADREPLRRKTGGLGRALRHLTVMTAVWLFGLAVGAAGIRFLPLEKSVETPIAQNDGEYLVEELGAETPSAPAREPAAAPEVTKVAAVAAEPVKSAPFDMKDVPVEVLDTIAAIPPWNPEGDIPDYVPAASASRETAGAFRPAEPVQVLQTPVPEPRCDTFTAVRPQAFAETAAAVPEPAAGPEEQFVPAPAFERIAENEARPMKNQIEYFEPFETVSYSSETEPALRVTASEDFYNDAYGVDSFSDYLPPHRDEEEIPSSGSPFQN